ncbi:MAG: hypothetical protein M3Y77_19385 [Actinomycetota bacterium]|nr:hypothetical protein [Actinomycetota bacterium]
MPARGIKITAADPGSGAARRPILLLVLRLVGAGLLAANAGIHAYLWNVGYRTIPTIGPLFLADAVLAAVLVIAVLFCPRGALPLTAAAGTLLELGTAAGLLVATGHGLFGFVESTRATLFWPSVATEVGGAVVLAVLTVLALRRSRSVATARSR